MTRLRSTWWPYVVCVLVMAGIDIRRMGASPSQPTISLTRNVALNSSVWPVDLNGDGITDLVASDTFANTFPQDGVILAVIGKGDGTFGSPIHPIRSRL